MQRLILFSMCFLLSCMCGAAGYEKDLAHARKLYRLKNYESARVAALKISPQTYTSKRLASLCYYRQKQFSSFLEETENLPASESPDFVLEFYKADSLMRLGKIQDANAITSGVLLDMPDHDQLSTVTELQYNVAKLLPPPVEAEVLYAKWLLSNSKRFYGRLFTSNCDLFFETHKASPYSAELLFCKMLALRQQKDWAASREVAETIIANYPSSVEARKMGGVAKSELEAAFAQAEINKLYSEKKFDQCIVNCKLFFAEFPENWRKEEVLSKYTYAAYHGNPALFKRLCSNFSFADSQELYYQLRYRLAALLTREGRGSDARTLLNGLNADLPTTSSLRQNVSQALLETYLYGPNMVELRFDQIDEARELLKSQLIICRSSDKHLTWYLKNLRFHSMLCKKANQPHEIIRFLHDENKLDLSPAQRIAIAVVLASHYAESNSGEALQALLSRLDVANKLKNTPKHRLVLSEFVKLGIRIAIEERDNKAIKSFKSLGRRYPPNG